MAFDQNLLGQFPTASGVYLMKDARGSVLYVGKANNLRTRVRQYFRPDADKRYQIKALLRKIAAIDTLVTDTEKEALLLEHTLIRTHHPRYNILFRDDKSYMSVRVNIHHAFPGIFRTRRVTQDGAQYFGPYTSGAACRETIEALTRFFRLRTCVDREFANRSRPCLQHQIGRCSAPCVGFITKEAYQGNLEQALLLLAGRQNELTAALNDQMRTAAREERFEDAARVRDLLTGIAETIEQQKVVRYDAVDCDYLGWFEKNGVGAVCVLHLQAGKVIGQHGAVAPLGGAEPHELITSFLQQLYVPPRVMPARLQCAADIPAVAALVEAIANLWDTATVVHLPKRGKEAQLTQLACTNAEHLLSQRAVESDQWERLAAASARALHLAQPPTVIECIDISNWQGTLAVASLVCFEAGARNVQRYRRYKIQGPNEPNDYAMMSEAVTRRLTGAHAPPAPDLLLIDGGRGHLQTALRVLQALHVTTLPVASIAKPREGEATDKIYLPGRKNPLPLKKGDPVLLYLQRIRDEAHRFAITYQRRRREKAQLSASVGAGE